MRVVQPAGQRGSLKWIQRAVAERWPALEEPIGAVLGDGAAGIDWRSRRADDGHAEYRDAAFLERLGLAVLVPSLAEFWPLRGPQWDALGLTAHGQVLLVEAKAHIGEFCTPGTAAGDRSRIIITDRLAEVASALGSSQGARWPDQFYQLANRLAHLYFLRRAGVDAYLVLVNFLDDRDMDGPAAVETWEAAYRLADYVLGLGRRHPLSPFLVHVYPSVLDHG